MQHYFLVYPLSDDWHQVSWCLCNPDGVTTASIGSLETFAQIAQLTPIIALVPGKWLNFFSVELPKARANMVKKALPFLLEEQLAEDLDAVHLVLPARYQVGQNTPVAVINKTLMRTMCDAFKTQGLNLQQAFPDWVCLPLFAQTWTIYLGQEMAFVRQSENLGFSIPKDLLMPMLNLALTQTTERPETLHVYHLALEAADMEEQLTTLSVPLAYEAIADDTLTWWAQHLTFPAPMNLLQDEFVIKQKSSPLSRSWRMAAAMAAGIVVVQIVHALLNHQLLQKQYDDVHTQVLALYTQVFPDAQQTNNARAQLEAELTSQGLNATNPLFVYLQDITEPLLTTAGVELQQLTLQNNTLRVEVVVNDFATLNQLESALSANGLTVAQDSASLEENRVVAQLHLSRGA